MDIRPIEAKTASNEVASVVMQLDKEVEEARIGIGIVNLVQLPNPLVFGKYNDRPKKDSEINKMVASLEANGLQGVKEANALPIMIKRERLSAGQTFGGTWTEKDSLTHIRFEDNGPIVLASGQHRVAALKKYLNTATENADALRKRMERLEEIRPPTSADVEEHKALRQELEGLLGEIGKEGQWGVILYDEGKQISVARAKNSASRGTGKCGSVHV
jgi:hypothetical protein